MALPKAPRFGYEIKVRLGSMDADVSNASSNDAHSISKINEFKYEQICTIKSCKAEH